MSAGISARTTISIRHATIDLQVHDCAACGVIYAISAILSERRAAEGGRWYCPNGHEQQYGESEVKRLKEELSRSERNRRFYTDLAGRRYDELQAQGRKLAATKGTVTKLRRRAIAGVCAFCHRHFVNVERHVATKHQNEKPED